MPKEQHVIKSLPTNFANENTFNVFQSDLQEIRNFKIYQVLQSDLQSIRNFKICQGTFKDYPIFK